MTDDGPVWWVTVSCAADGHPTDNQLRNVRDALGETFDDEANVLVTSGEIEPIDANDAKEIVRDLIDALEGVE